MNTRHFVYAIEVERTGSITQAADNLFMSQPTLSKAIKDLEETLGFAVFQRTPRGVVPTRKGEAFLVHARKIVGQIEKMERALHAGDTQTFSIAIPRAGDLAAAVSGFISSLELDG
ncbi:MAG: LysR family transcriptional regulator, partial [Oscillospiraceae bacterium]|nr:LysR family transcriptional regulator [Oscillospiraceae bacterium]